MTKSSIEITETQYLIRLHREEFGYSKLKEFLRHLMSEHTSLSNHDSSDIVDEDNHMEYGDRFDHLSDK